MRRMLRAGYLMGDTEKGGSRALSMNNKVKLQGVPAGTYSRSDLVTSCTTLPWYFTPCLVGAS
jgi:hypothetical protein